MTRFLIEACGVGNGGCPAPMYFYDACTRNWRAQEKGFWSGQMQMVGRVEDPDQLARYLEKRRRKNS
jgi:hypothetical protein